MGRDLITRPYGRFYHLPRIMAAKGHEVFVLLLSHRRDGRLRVEKDGVTWMSESLYPAGPLPYLKHADSLVRRIRPDWLVGFSDTYYGILAARLAGRYGLKSVIDAYDNYESYMEWLRPLHALWRKAISRADVVTAAGPQLGEYMDAFRPVQGRKAFVVPMAADPTGFVPLDRGKCRAELNLPFDQKLVGYCGSLHRNRGIETLFEMFQHLRKIHPGVEMVLTGRKDRTVRLPSHVRWLGYVPDDKVALVLNSVDVLLVVNQLSTFGRYSYPVKLYEAMSCQVPVVASATEAASWILRGKVECLAQAGDPRDLAEKVGRLLSTGRIDYGVQNTWEGSCELFLEALTSNGTPVTANPLQSTQENNSRDGSMGPLVRKGSFSGHFPLEQHSGGSF